MIAEQFTRKKSFIDVKDSIQHRMTYFHTQKGENICLYTRKKEKKTNCD